MLKTFISIVLLVLIAVTGNAQKLESFTVTLPLKDTSNSYVSISKKKVYTPAEAKSNKTSVDLALVATKSGNNIVMEWYNMNGKDDKIPAELIGTATGISSLSFDKDLFNKCNTKQDLQRMTGHITKNSFVHFASITDDMEKGGIKYHCILVQLENGKRALLWLEAVDNNTVRVLVKAE